MRILADWGCGGRENSNEKKKLLLRTMSPVYSSQVHVLNRQFGVRIKGRRSIQLNSKENPEQSRRNRQDAEIDGFLATRFVTAQSQAEAEQQVISLIHAQLEKTLPDQTWSFEVHEAWEDHERATVEGPGRGFTWFGKEKK